MSTSVAPSAAGKGLGPSPPAFSSVSTRSPRQSVETDAGKLDAQSPRHLSPEEPSGGGGLHSRSRADAALEGSAQLQDEAQQGDEQRQLPSPSSNSKSSSPPGSVLEAKSMHSQQQQQQRSGQRRCGWRAPLDLAIKLLTYSPRRVRWDPKHPPRFSLALNVLFGFAGAFTVGNLYYSHPILNILAQDFGVSNEKASQIPTLAQAGYATGLLLLNPLGDVFRRRAFVLTLVWCTATLWIGLCITKSFTAFSAITFLTGVTTVTPQIMLPLVGDLAPPHRRAAALSIVNSGNLLGILIARLLSGIVANYTSWRNVYWVAFGLQYLILALLWNFMPDYPATNAALPYHKMLLSMLGMLRKHPVLVQACILSYCSSAPFTNYWTTLTFLLSGHYGYAPLPIGLWALIGIAGICITPLFARRIIDGFVPLFSTALGEVIALIGVIVGTYSGLYSVAGPALQAFFLDLGLGTAQVANRSAIYSCEPNARNRINTVYMLSTFLGQITGTAAGNRLYARDGWAASGSLSVGFLGFAVLVIGARGPWEPGWVGWRGGWGIRKKDKMSANGFSAEQAMHTIDPVSQMKEGTENADRVAKAIDAPPDVEKAAIGIVEREGGKEIR